MKFILIPSVLSVCVEKQGDALVLEPTQKLD